ncbi:hypothetical protein V1478_005557, partial [Vespula squamosa]
VSHKNLFHSINRDIILQAKSYLEYNPAKSLIIIIRLITIINGETQNYFLASPSQHEDSLQVIIHIRANISGTTYKSLCFIVDEHLT